MPNRMHHHLELSGETATLHLGGRIGAENTATLLDLCSRLPASIGILRVDLRAMGRLSADALGAVRSLLHHWRTTRQGEFRLMTSYLQATCQRVETPDARPSVATPAVAHHHPWQIQHPEWVPSFGTARPVARVAAATGSRAGFLLGVANVSG